MWYPYFLVVHGPWLVCVSHMTIFSFPLLRCSARLAKQCDDWSTFICKALCWSKKSMVVGKLKGLYKYALVCLLGQFQKQHSFVSKGNLFSRKFYCLKCFVMLPSTLKTNFQIKSAFRPPHHFTKWAISTVSNISWISDLSILDNVIPLDSNL